MFDKSIAALQRLNALGYGQPDGKLPLNLVYNPQGPSLPPDQHRLEADYKRELGAHFGIEFNALYALANMPIQRFGSTLVSKGQFASYMQLLKDAYRAENLDTVMCKSLVSVDWQGYLYDCDFNQMLGIRLRLDGAPRAASARPARARHRRRRGARRRPLLRLHRGPGQQLRRRVAGGVTRAPMTPRLSIVMPVLDEAATLRRCCCDAWRRCARGAPS